MRRPRAKRSFNSTVSGVYSAFRPPCTAIRVVLVRGCSRDRAYQPGRVSVVRFAGVGINIFETYTLSPQPTVAEEAGLLLSAIFLMMLSLKVPAIAGAMITARPSRPY